MKADHVQKASVMKVGLTSVAPAPIKGGVPTSVVMTTSAALAMVSHAVCDARVSFCGKDGSREYRLPFC